MDPYFGVIKQTPVQTPPEELDWEWEDEQCYRREESKEEKRADAEDADWVPY